MILVDSSVWIGFFANVRTPEVNKLIAIKDRTEILVGDIVLLEVLRGARSDNTARNIEADLRRFDIAQMLDPEVAVIGARNYRHLRSRGITIRNSVDVIIGTYCILHDHFLLHRDRDFTHMQESLGLKVY